MVTYLIKFQAIYQDKINRLLSRLRDVEDELPELAQKKKEAEVRGWARLE